MITVALVHLLVSKKVCYILCAHLYSSWDLPRNMYELNIQDQYWRTPIHCYTKSIKSYQYQHQLQRGWTDGIADRKHDSFVRKPFGTSPTEAWLVTLEQKSMWISCEGIVWRQHIRQPQTRVWWIRGFHPPAEGGEPMGCWMHICMFVKLFSCKVEQAKVNSSKSMRALGGGILQQLCRSCSNSTPFNCIAPAFWASGQFSGIPSFQIHSSHRESRASMNDIPIDDMVGPLIGYGKDWYIESIQGHGISGYMMES